MITCYDSAREAIGVSGCAMSLLNIVPVSIPGYSYTLNLL